MQTVEIRLASEEWAPGLCVGPWTRANTHNECRVLPPQESAQRRTVDAVDEIIYRMMGCADADRE